MNNNDIIREEILKYFSKKNTFYLPEVIKSSTIHLEELFNFHKKILNSELFDIQISFKNITHFESSLCSVLGAIFENIEGRNIKVKYVGLVEFIKINGNYLARNSFIPRLMKYEDVNLSFIDKDTEFPYKKFSIDESNKYNKFIREELLQKPKFPSHSAKLSEKIELSIFELFENARTHGECKFIHTSGQFIDNNFNISIVDTGISISNKVRSFLKEFDKPSSECIDWAMKHGNTTKKGNIPGGLGLNLVLEFIKKNEGKVTIISSDGYWKLESHNAIIKKTLSEKFRGTIVMLEFNLKDSKKYYLKTEIIENDEDIF